MPRLKDWERYDTPHCVYRLYRADGQALYIGCSHQPFSRLAAHEGTQEWWLDVTTIKLAWYPTWHHGRSVEMGAIIREHPLHNRMVHDVAHVGMGIAGVRTDGIRKRGDGKHCPKCGAEKEDRTKAYCRNCVADYQRERRRLSAESLARALNKV